MVPLENASIVESVRNLNAKCGSGVRLHFLQLMQKNQMILCSIVFTMAQYTVPLKYKICESFVRARL